MSIKLMTCAWELDIASTDKMVLLCLCDFANDFGLSCYPSVNLLAKKCSTTTRTVQRALLRLEESGFIERIERPGTSSEFKLDVGKIVTPDILSPLTKRTKRGDTESPKPSKNHQNNKSARETEIEDDWQPEPFNADSQCEKIISRWSKDERERQIELFRAHHRKLGNRFADWQAAWKTWVLRSFDLRPAGGASARGSEGEGSFIDRVISQGRRSAPSDQRGGSGHD